jgi:DNA primase
MPTRTRIADRDIALVRDHNPIYSVVLEAHVELTDTEDGNAKGPCPFHSVLGRRETTRSFHVTPDRGMWFCYACGEGGDVITFVMKKLNLTFAEAVQRLAQRAGVSLTHEAVSAP